ILMRHKPQVVHFSGHGEKSGAVVLIGSDGQAKDVPPKAFAGLFRVLKDNVRVVVLNACDSEPQAKAIVKEIDVAIGMSDAIDDELAIAFAAEFYQGLAYGPGRLKDSRCPAWQGASGRGKGSPATPRRCSLPRTVGRG